MRVKMSAIAAVVIGAGFTALASFPAMRASAQVRPEAWTADPKRSTAQKWLPEGSPETREEKQVQLSKRQPDPVRFPVPRTSWDGKPDFNGVYYPYVDIEPAPVPLDSLYRPEVQALRKKLHPEITPNMHCYPNIFTVSMTRPHPIEVFHGPGVLVAITEVFGIARVIPIVDGPPRHDPSVRASFQGDAVAHWDGDTLVVDVTKFNGKGWLFRDMTLTSDELHMIERWTRPDAETLEYQAVVDDRKMLTGPWTSPKMRRGRLKHDFSSFDPCLDDSEELEHTIAAIEAEPAQIKLSRDVLLHGATKILERESK